MLRYKATIATKTKKIEAMQQLPTIKQQKKKIIIFRCFNFY